MARKAIIIAPFWLQSGHVSIYRVERFIRWFNEGGIEVVLICGGAIDRTIQQSWGTELTIKDPVGLYRETGSAVSAPKPRSPNKWRRFLAEWLFVPDPGIVWANYLIRHPAVLSHVQDAEFVLSSSPPESAHVSSWRLAEKLACKLIIDMRDGWLDEPLKPLLRTSFLRRWLEGRLEKKILSAADTVFVSSERWRTLLVGRNRVPVERIEVLTNAYPDGIGVASGHRVKNPAIELLHTGQFRGSRASQNPALLLQPLLTGLEFFYRSGQVTLMGALSETEQQEIEMFNQAFSKSGWTLRCVASAPRQQVFDRITKADGLLLLCAAEAAIPSKIFEYIPTGRPILIVSHNDSAVWQVGKLLAQAVLLDYKKPETWKQAMAEFADKIVNDDLDYTCPEQFSVACLGAVFSDRLGFERKI